MNIIRSGKEAIKSVIRATGYELSKLPQGGHSFPPNIYNQDSLRTTHNHDFMNDLRFKAAYDRGCRACGEDLQMHWRVHVALWIAEQSRRMGGDFVECGVNRGMLSTAIMKYLDWDSTGRSFFLFDTFCGIDERLLLDTEIEKNKIHIARDKYEECFEKAVANFSEYKNIQLIRGSIPDTLTVPNIEKVSYLSIDMNCIVPEIAAANYFWDKLTPGAFVLLDDYAYVGFDDQKKAFDQFATEHGIQILSLPTGQGVYQKPHD